MFAKKLCRRDLLKFSAIGLAGTVLAACQPKVVEKVVKETVVVEKKVEVEKEVTKVVEKEVPKEVKSWRRSSRRPPSPRRRSLPRSPS